MQKIKTYGLFTLFLCLYSTFPSMAAQIDARVTHMKGAAEVISAKAKARQALNLGDRVSEGDRVITEKGARVEIQFSTGAKMLVGENSNLAIKTIRQEPAGAIQAIFSLASGMIRSSFSMITSSDIVKYRTKAAVAGIAGTPEHIVKAGLNSKGVPQTYVYLFGRQGEAGSLFVAGTDKAKTRVKLAANKGTMVLMGLAPAVPFALTPNIIKPFADFVFASGETAVVAGGVAAAKAESSMGLGTIGAAGGAAALGAVALSQGGGGSGDDSGGSTGDDGGAGGMPDVSGVYAGSWRTECDSVFQGGFAMNVNQDKGQISGTLSSDPPGPNATFTGAYNAGSTTWPFHGSGADYWGQKFEISGQISGTTVTATGGGATCYIWHHPAGTFEYTFTGSKQ